MARPLHEMGVLTTVDRGALAAYCQAWGRWVEAEQKLKETPLLLKTPSGYVQQSPWLSVSNKQLELMGRYMAELGITPASRCRVANLLPQATEMPMVRRIIYRAKDGKVFDTDGNEVAEEQEGAITVDGDP